MPERDVRRGVGGALATLVHPNQGLDPLLPRLTYGRWVQQPSGPDHIQKLRKAGIGYRTIVAATDFDIYTRDSATRIGCVLNAAEMASARLARFLKQI